MFKKIISFVLFLIFYLLFILNNVFASSSQPGINCAGLPGCKQDDTIAIDGGTKAGNIGLDFVVNLISQFIQFIAVIAVFALIFSGILYLISMGEEEKTKKAKNWIIYSLLGVFVSISAWGIINLINNIRIGY